NPGHASGRFPHPARPRLLARPGGKGVRAGPHVRPRSRAVLVARTRGALRRMRRRQTHGEGRGCRPASHRGPARRPVRRQGPGVCRHAEENGTLHPGCLLMTTPDRLPLASLGTLTPASPAGSVPGEDLLDLLLAEQQSLTAAERFAVRHDDGTDAAFRVEHKSFYRDLIPLRTPGPGEQYAFEVDLDRCTGCKACVTA